MTMTAKRILDVVVATLVLLVTSPLFVFAAIGIALTSPGPIFYRARRIARDRRCGASASRLRAPERRRRDGYHGREFTMYKFRTMRVAAAGGNPVSSFNDSRVFPFGGILRATKIDELPQLVNVLRGEMSIVGPRPEAPDIVRNHYTPDDLVTLRVRPGVTSPGTVYYYSHCEGMLTSDAAMDVYLKRLLPLKLALDRVYIGQADIRYDIRLILRTIFVIAGRAVGIERFPKPPELTVVGSNQTATTSTSSRGR